MKRYFYLFLTLLTVSFPMALTSCGDDDDDANNAGGGGTTPTLKVENQTESFRYVYWNIDESNSSGTKKLYQIEFCSFDLAGGVVPDKGSFFYVSFMADGSNSELPTGSFSDFEVSGGLNFSSRTGEPGVYFEKGKNCGNLVITKENGSYSVTIEPLYVLSGDEPNLVTTQTSLKYRGSLPKAPKEFAIQ